jgi:hypothetical protein
MRLSKLNIYLSRTDDLCSIDPRTWHMQLVRLARASLLVAAVLAAAPADAQPYGPDTCSQGYVWREAFPGDHVCVRPEVRAQAAADNAAGPSRRQPGGGASGPDTCLPGFVWRDARPGDHVCVPPATREQTASDNRLAGNRLASSSGDALTFNKPRYMDDRLDWCLNWGANCGQPAALEFCHRRRFENVQGFEPEKVGRSARTRLMGTGQTCDGDFCTAFLQITCAGRIPSTRVFANPENNGYRLDVCREWGANCGKPAADAFCVAQGFRGSLHHTPDPEPGRNSTRVISSGQICEGKSCTGFQQIICQ